MTHEYKFDLKTYAVVRVRAGNEADARVALLAALDGVEFQVPRLDRSHVAFLQASLYVDDELGPELLSVDGADVDS